MRMQIAAGFLLGLVISLAAVAGGAAEAARYDAMVGGAAESARYDAKTGGAAEAARYDAMAAEAAFRGTVKRAETRDRQLGVRELFTAAFYFCRSGKHLDALDTIFDVAAEMQDRREGSRGCGNFRWYWRDGYVMDFNAVDFCMEQGVLIARDYMGLLTDGQRKKFQALLDWSIRGCMAHRVRDSYTNIAIMNSVNLILLGEVCKRAEVFAEGVKRLDAFMLNTALYGVCEYSSPTYTAVDVSNLHRLHANVRDPATKQKAEKLLRLFWTDLAASAFPGAGRLGGPHSRDYDYLYGMGGVAPYLWTVGLCSPIAGRVATLPDYAADDWRIDDSIRALARTTPRLLENRWGAEDSQYRVYWAGKNVALGTAGANYWNMDIPLAVDFAATNQLVRGYFIADGRRDPYGRKRIPEGQGPHQKTLHLRPFWAGVQRGREALGLVVYRPQDIPEETPTLESHFVFSSGVEEIRIGEERVKVESGKPFARELHSGDVVFARQGAGAMGVRVVWSAGIGGSAAKVALVWDAVPGVPACRLTVAHHDYWGARGDSPTAPRPGAAFWVRVCDEAGDAKQYAEFRKGFMGAATGGTPVVPVGGTPVVPVGGTPVVPVGGRALSGIGVEVAGEEGPLAIEARAPFDQPQRLVPMPKLAVLAVNGRDLGAEILGEVPGLAEYRAELERTRRAMEQNRILLFSGRQAMWEAEKGAVVPKMVVAKDPLAYGGEYVWAPGVPGAGGGGPGHVAWQLEVAQKGTYQLWGRVFAPTPSDDSFCVMVTEGEYAKRGLRGEKLLPKTDWPVGVTNGQWKWVKFNQSLELPKGAAVLSLHVREDGTKIDRLALTDDPSADLR